MAIKKNKPCTPSQRHSTQIILKYLSKKPQLKNKIKGFTKKPNGRNFFGKITVNHKGKGHKKKIRKIDFKRKNKITGITYTIEYDPNRNAHIASIYNYNHNNFFYILAPKHLNIGDIVKSGVNISNKLGYSLPLFNIPTGSLVHNVSSKKNTSGQIARSAGSFAQVKSVTFKKAKIKLSSGKQTTISAKCFATIGIVSNESHFLTQLGKAGKSRWLNKRPSVRGVAMNPVDHPHGGGEGKKSGKKQTPWGKTNHKS